MTWRQQPHVKTAQNGMVITTLIKATQDDVVIAALMKITKHGRLKQIGKFGTCKTYMGLT